MSNFETEFGLDQIIFQVTRQRQTNSIKDGPKHEESCLDLVFIDDVGRVLEKDVIFCLVIFRQFDALDQAAGMIIPSRVWDKKQVPKACNLRQT